MFSSYAHIYQQALLLLCTCLQQLPMHDSTTQNVLLASAPATNAAELQQLLARTHFGPSWLDASKTASKAAAATAAAGMSDAGQQTNASWGSIARSKYGHSRVRSPIAMQAVGSSAAASLSSSMHSFVGGGDPTSGRPMPWAVGQLLPWPERGADGPAHQMIAVQQVLFKGLLFQDTQLPAVQLLTLLARGLCQLPPSAGRPPMQAPAAAGFDRDGDGIWGRDQGLLGMLRPGTPSSFGSSRTGSRATTGTPSRSSSRESPAASAGEAATQNPRIRNAPRFGAASLQQEQLLAQVPAGQQQPQQQQVQQQQQQQQVCTADKQHDLVSVSRSAPELHGFGTTAAAAAALHGHTMSSSGLGAIGGHLLEGSQNAAIAQQQQQQRSIAPGRKLQHPGSDAAATAGLSSSWGVWSVLLNGTAAAGTAKKAPGSRAVSQSLLGHRHSQLLVSIAAVVPFLCSQLGQLEPDSELLEALMVGKLCVDLSLHVYMGFHKAAGRIQ